MIKMCQVKLEITVFDYEWFLSEKIHFQNIDFAKVMDYFQSYLKIKYLI